jgi:hypothetical protein
LCASTSNKLNPASLSKLFRKNVHVGGNPGNPLVNACTHPATDRAYSGITIHDSVFVTT